MYYVGGFRLRGRWRKLGLVNLRTGEAFYPRLHTPILLRLMNQGTTKRNKYLLRKAGNTKISTKNLTKKHKNRNNRGASETFEIHLIYHLSDE